MRVYLILVWILAAPSLIAASSDNVAALHKEAKEAFANRNFKLAEEKFQKALAMDSTVAELHMDYAEMLFSRNLFIPAREQLLTVLRQNPGHLPTLRILFDDACRHKNWKGVMEYGNALQKTEPSLPIMEEMAKALYYTDENSAAIQVLNKIIAQKPTHESYVMLGRCYNDINDHKRAIDAYIKATELNPNKGRTWYELAFLWISVPDYNKAATCLEQAAMHGEKQDVIFAENLANIYIQTPQFEKGIAILQELLEKRPGDTHSMFLIAQAYYRNREYNKAYGWWEKTLQSDEANFRAMYMMGKAMQKMGKQKKGEELCNAAIGKDPSLQSMRVQMEFGGMQ